GTGDSFAVTAFASGFVASFKEKVAPGEALRFELSRGLSLDGVVLDARTKEPIQGARVESSTLPYGAIAPSYLPGFGNSESESDGRGRFSLSALPAGPVYVSASARGYGRVDIRARGGEEAFTIFLIPGAGSIAGVVLSPEGEPLAGASVVALETGNPSTGRWNWGRRAETDSKGRFEILGLRPDLYRVLAYHPDAAFRILPEVRVEESELLVDDVRLPSGFRISGRMVDEDGEPLQGEIRVESFDGDRAPHYLLDRMIDLADARGEFELEKLAPGEYGILAQASGFPAERVTALLEDEAGVDLGPIVFDGGLGISGVVVDAGGEPLAGAQVAASKGSGLMDRLIEGESETATAETVGDGSFELRGLEEGSYRLNAGAVGYTREPLAVEAGTTDVVLALRRAGAIAGTVVGENGEPVIGYHVTAERGDRSSGERRRTSTSASDGRFLVEGLAAGEFAITVSAEGLKPGKLSRLSVKPGETTDVGTIVLRTGGRIRGTVSSSEGAPVAGASVEGIPSS
ncbi:MAG: carboxypeptidase regulatory-like domain-containing protein, partial [Vicinamibacteria bacterium]